MKLYDDNEWISSMYMTFIGRLINKQNSDIVKKLLKSPTHMREIYRKIGTLNLFNSYRPNGMYILNCSIHEEKSVLQAIVEMARKEGPKFISDVKLDGKGIDSGEIVKTIPKQG